MDTGKDCNERVYVVEEGVSSDDTWIKLKKPHPTANEKRKRKDMSKTSQTRDIYSTIINGRNGQQQGADSNNNKAVKAKSRSSFKLKPSTLPKSSDNSTAESIAVFPSDANTQGTVAKISSKINNHNKPVSCIYNKMGEPYGWSECSTNTKRVIKKYTVHLVN